jgi:phosphoribosylanthranilate isomerase
MYVKVCGITQLDDALSAIAAGADVLGFNFIPSSKRRIDPSAARHIIEETRGRALAVAVVADLDASACAALLSEVPVDRIQLHGDEAPELVRALGARAFKALRIGSLHDVESARSFPGHPLLVDAKVEGELGGTGQRIDWPLIVPLAAARAIILAGGLTPENVAAAVTLVQPCGVDVASGVEVKGDPRRKDPEKLRRFVDAARAAARHTAVPPF